MIIYWFFVKCNSEFYISPLFSKYHLSSFLLIKDTMVTHADDTISWINGKMSLGPSARKILFLIGFQLCHSRLIPLKSDSHLSKGLILFTLMKTL